MSTNPRQSEVYGNWLMLAPDGTEMCRCGRERVDWYLERGLAEIVSEESKSFKLTFEPKAKGQFGSSYYLGAKDNKCVVCGDAEHGINRHHVVPYQYRKFFPLEFKSRRSHDIVVLCLDHHEAYEVFARRLCQQISVETGVPIQSGTFRLVSVQALKASRSAHALLTKGHLMPEERKQFLRRSISDYLEREVTDADLPEVQMIETRTIYGSNGETHGKCVVSLLTTVQAILDFERRWRAHFVATMNPKFLPEGWQIDNVPERLGEASLS